MLRYKRKLADDRLKLVARAEAERVVRAIASFSRKKRVHTQPGASAIGAEAIGTLMLGAFAIGALAIGAVAIGRLAIGRARIRRLEIDELVVRRLRITEQLQSPDTSAPEPAVHEPREERRRDDARALALLRIHDAPGFNPAPFALFFGHRRVAIVTVEQPDRAEHAELAAFLVTLLGKPEPAVHRLDSPFAIPARRIEVVIDDALGRGVEPI